MVWAHSVARFQKRSLGGQVPRCKDHGRISMVAGGGVGAGLGGSVNCRSYVFFSLCFVVIQTSFASCANEHWMIYVPFWKYFRQWKEYATVLKPTMCSMCINRKKQAWQILKYSNNHYKLSQDYCDLLYLIVSFLVCMYFQFNQINGQHVYYHIVLW